MHSSSRIISAEDLGDAVEPFSLGALSAGPSTPLRQRAVVRPEPVGKPDDTLRQTFELGYRKGMAAGRAAAEQQAVQEQQALGATLRQRVEMLAQSLEAEIAEFQHGGAEKLIDLAIEIARQTLRGNVELRRDAVLPVVQEALEQLYGEPTSTLLLLNPIDVELVQSNLAGMLARRQIEVRADRSITPGGCRLQSDSADVDATLVTRWRRTLGAMGRTDPLADDGQDPFVVAPD